MRIFKRGMALTIGAAAVLAGSVLTSSPALAASSPIEACGGGSYHVIDSHALGDAATLYLLYNGSTDCVVTWKKSPYAGSNTGEVYAEVQRQSDLLIDDDIGYYSYYAGPAKVTAPGTCIRWVGHIWVPRPTGGSILYSWDAGWSHCG